MQAELLLLAVSSDIYVVLASRCGQQSRCC